MFKKLTALFLLVTFISAFTSPLCGGVSANTGQETLKDFLKTTENITAAYVYPSMKLSSAEKGKTVLPAHTPVIMRCNETISTSDFVSGSSVSFTVVNDVKDAKGLVLIKAGTPVSAQVVFAKNKGMIGQSGKITISDFHTTAVDGTYIPLSCSISMAANSRMTTSIVLSVFICILFLLMQGEEASVAAGTTKTAYTAAETYIKATAN